ncbi:IS1595 family transposase [Patescibacteria group bacterium]|nr:IS1595 family transposase [Patescibacteria group bacterium]
MNLTRFLRIYQSDEACLETIKDLRWPDGIVCPKCRHIEKFYKITGRMGYACGKCGKHVYPLKGTIFEKTTLSLQMWFYAIFVITSTRSGVSAKQLQRELEVSYVTSHRMFKRIRAAMVEPEQALSGIVEVDETYVGGKTTNRRHKYGVSHVRKQVLMGMVARGGRVKVVHIPNIGKHTLLGQIKKNITPGATIMSDELPSYRWLSRMGYIHKSVEHAKGEYANGDSYTNTIENFWSHLKRGIYGVYRKVSPEYLGAYANEYAWRYNYRKKPEMMFPDLLAKASSSQVSELPFLMPKKFELPIIEEFFEDDGPHGYF